MGKEGQHCSNATVLLVLIRPISEELIMSSTTLHSSRFEIAPVRGAKLDRSHVIKRGGQQITVLHWTGPVDIGVAPYGEKVSTPS